VVGKSQAEHASSCSQSPSQIFGYPKQVVSDRGLHNRGEFAEGLAARGCIITNIGVESPEQLGRIERHGGLLKAMVAKTIAEIQAVGEDLMTQILTQRVTAKNSMSRVRGFTPSQWVLGRIPREPGTAMEEEWCDLGVLEMASDPNPECGKIASIREAARKPFIRADLSSRVSRAILRH